MTMNNELMQQESVRRSMDKRLDSSLLISPETLHQKHWLSFPVPDILNPMEAEWLADAIHAKGVQEVVGIAFEYEGKPDIETMPVTQESLLTYNGSNSWRTVMMTSADEDFLYYKDEANRYYLLCGDQVFLSQAYRCTLRTAKAMYFDEWVNLDHHSKEERGFMTEIWNRYVGEDDTA